MQNDYLTKSKKYKGFHYSVLSQEQIDYLHRTTLKIFKYIAKILDEENIPYVIVGGTLLGAVTTGRFIPWDDDLDVCLFDDDYDRAIDILCENLPDWIIVQCKKTEPNYFHGWTKVRDKKSCVYPLSKSYTCNGVWVDLYRIKKIKRKFENQEIIQEHINYLERRCSVGDISVDEKIKRMKENNLEKRLFEATSLATNSEDESYIYQIQSASKISMEIGWVFPLKKVNFEGLSVSTICMPEKYLIQHYGGSYTELPPDEMRRVGICDIKY